MLPDYINPLMMTRRALWGKSLALRNILHRKDHERRSRRRTNEIRYKAATAERLKDEHFEPEVRNGVWKPSMEWQISQESQEHPERLTTLELRMFLRAWGLMRTLTSVAYRLNLSEQATKYIADFLGLTFVDLNMIHEEMALKSYLQGMPISEIKRRMQWNRKGIKAAILKAYKRRWDPTQADCMIPWLPPPMDYHEVRIIHTLHSDDRLWCWEHRLAQLANEEEMAVHRYMKRAEAARKTYEHSIGGS